MAARWIKVMRGTFSAWAAEGDGFELRVTGSAFSPSRRPVGASSSIVQVSAGPVPHLG